MDDDKLHNEHSLDCHYVPLPHVAAQMKGSIMPKMKTIRILIYKGKHGDQYWLADTPARLVQAQTALFKQLDEQGFYEDEDQDHLKQARAGNIRAIRGILDSRQCCEYEEWELEHVEVPCNSGVPGEAELLDFNTYQKAAQGTRSYPRSAGINYPALGLAGEGGEVANQVKKIIRDDGGKITPERKAAILKELGDVLWYVADIATELGADLSTVAFANLDKLYDRKDRGTIVGDGDNR
jgi:NTP pyrophosphatase (non-canonical NTP hydrolase)